MKREELLEHISKMGDLSITQLREEDSARVLDSIAVLELISFSDENLKIKISVDAISRANTVADILNMLQNK
jgi:acyl carrier protein